jgi:hypothetical protein
LSITAAITITTFTIVVRMLEQFISTITATAVIAAKVAFLLHLIDLELVT